MKTALSLLAAFLAVRCAAADAPPGQRVFLTGHSFHVFVARQLTQMVEAAGIKGHTINAQSIGGSTVLQHWNLPDEKNGAKRALTAGEVDVLTMSPKWDLPDEGIERFVELGLQHNPKLRVLVQESWSPYDGWLPEERVKANDERDTRGLDTVRASKARWDANLQKQLRALNAKHGREVCYLVPVGDAVLALRELIAAGKAPGLSKQTDLFTDPIGHGKPPLTALTTYCNFAALYRTSPVGLADKQPALDALSPELKPLLQRLAWEAVTKHPMSGVKP